MANWPLNLRLRAPLKLVHLGLELVFPAECLACEYPGEYLCKDCLERCLHTPPALVCPECNKPSAVGLTHQACKHPHGIDGIFAAGSFANPLLQLAIKELKYRNLKDAAKPLSQFLKRHLLENFGTFIGLYKPTIAPVPLHAGRLNFRGFNQSAILAKSLAEILNLPFEEALERKIPTQDQVKLNRQERLENVKNAFELKGSASGKNYFVIDDVTTTGATLKECAKVLKRNKAASVWGVALAYEAADR